MTFNNSGIYGLFRFDGGPIDHIDVLAMGFELTSLSDGPFVAPLDLIDVGSAHCDQNGRLLSILIGHIDDSAELAARLSLRIDAPPLTIALAAHDRFGDDIPRMMMGGWTLLRWDGHARSLVVAQSINGRNRVLLARHGPRLAIAPDLQALLRLGWVSDNINAADITDSLISTLFSDDADRLFVSSVRKLRQGGVLRTDATSEQLHQCDPHLPITRWQGSFEDALAATEDLLRRSVRGVLDRSPRVAAFNSGGLDSSMLSWMASTERKTSHNIPLIASAVDPERGIDDEMAFSRIVADHLGEPLFPVVPPRDANLYCPSLDDFLGADTPPTSSLRHYVYDAFKRQALALGVTHILDGVLGELTVTSPMELADWRRRIHLRLRAIRMRYTHPDLQPRWPDDAVQVWLAPHLMQSLPDTLRQRWRQRRNRSMVRQRGELWGYAPSLKMMMGRDLPELANGRLRLVMPFRDIRLQQLFAGFPVDYLTHGGLDRAPARHILRGNLPDSISLRPKGLAFSPDYHLRLAEHAAAAARRIPVFRRAGLGEWFDLDRLEIGLGQVHRFDRAQLHSTVKIQMTAHACEFFLWWVNGRRAEAYIT